jgi:GNAT superfamily N-acetyltransferase
VIGWHLSPGLRRRVGYSSFFAWGLYELEPQGQIYGVHRDGGLAAVGAWNPPREAAPPGLRARAAAGVVRLLYPHRARTLFAGFAGMARMHPEEPHWYLAFVGVEPRLHGIGLGAKVLRPVLDLADAEGALCYLETPFRQTHAFYGRLGFELTRELQPDETPFEAPAPVWTMSRQPGRRTDPAGASSPSPGTTPA